MIQMIAHGLSAAGLFILCGQLYERLHTRDMRMMGGLWGKMKWLPALSMFFAVATLGMPGTGNFVGEFMILFGSYRVVPMITVISTFGLVFASVYSLAMLHRAYFGKAKSQIASRGTARDVAARAVYHSVAGGASGTAWLLSAADSGYLAFCDEQHPAVVC